MVGLRNGVGWVATERSSVAVAFERRALQPPIEGYVDDSPRCVWNRACPRWSTVAPRTRSHGIAGRLDLIETLGRWGDLVAV